MVSGFASNKVRLACSCNVRPFRRSCSRRTSRIRQESCAKFQMQVCSPDVSARATFSIQKCSPLTRAAATARLSATGSLTPGRLLNKPWHDIRCTASYAVTSPSPRAAELSLQLRKRRSVASKQSCVRTAGKPAIKETWAMDFAQDQPGKPPDNSFKFSMAC